VATKRVHLFVSGDVQGVGFRWYCRDEALERGVGGFVRNVPDGRVEAAFEGDPAAVDALVEWCRSGPRSATVTSMDVQEEDPVGETEFGITR
jgi:acylphosphatase